MKHTTVAVVLALSICVATTALTQTNDGYVGVFGDAAGTIHCMHAAPGVPTTLYVVAKTAGASTNGITGAEFRIQFVNPDGYFLGYTAPESSLTLGAPLDSTGFNISFRSCQASAGGIVSLGTIMVFNAGSGGQTDIIVKRRNPPSNPTFPYALFTLCDVPVYTKSRMTFPPDSVSCLTQKPRVRVATPATSNEFITWLDGSGAGGGGSAPAATFQSLATLQGRLPVDSPWSPTDQRLAFLGADGALYIFDAATPAVPPTLVLPSSSDYIINRYISWSPDGQWIACRTQEVGDVRAGLASIVARNAAGTGPITTLLRGEVGRFTWAANGTIYCWDTSRRRTTVSPPTEWQPGTPPAVERPFLQPLPSTNALSEFRTRPQEHERQLTLQATNVYAAFAVDAFPDMQKYVITVQDNTRGFYSAVVDQDGNVVVDLGGQVGANGFTATSVSPDGRYVLGFHEVDQDETIAGARLYLVAADGAWRIPVEPAIDGLDPKFARTGDLIAFMELSTGGIRVGHLQVSE